MEVIFSVPGSEDIRFSNLNISLFASAFEAEFLDDTIYCRYSDFMVIAKGNRCNFTFEKKFLLFSDYFQLPVVFFSWINNRDKKIFDVNFKSIEELLDFSTKMEKILMIDSFWIVFLSHLIDISKKIKIEMKSDSFLYFSIGENKVCTFDPPRKVVEMLVGRKAHVFCLDNFPENTLPKKFSEFANVCLKEEYLFLEQKEIYEMSGGERYLSFISKNIIFRSVLSKK